MKRLLTTTTAISMAFATIPPLPGSAQTVLNINGQSVICLAAKTAECPEGALCVVAKKPENCERNARMAIKALENGAIPATGIVDQEVAKAAAAAAKAEAAQSKADAGVEADAAVKADADAAAKAEADAAMKAEAAANANAEAEAAAQAEAAQNAETDAAQAEAEAVARAEAAAQAEAAQNAETDAAQAEAEAIARAEAAAQAEAAQNVETDAAQAEAEAIARAEAAAAAAETPSAEDLAAQAEAEAAAQAALEAAAADESADPASFPTVNINGQTVICLPSKAAVCPEGEFCVVAKIQDNCEANATKALAKAEPVETPVPTEEAVSGLSDAIDEPTEGPDTSPQAEAGDEEPVPAGDVTEEVISEDDVRGPGEEFDEPPTEVAPGKKSGLSDLEKVGLIALGALAVGSIINSNREVVSNSGDRVVVRQPDGSYVIYKDDDALLRQPGNTVRTETYRDGSTRTIVTREDGSQVVTVRDATGRVLRRVAYDKDGREYVLINDMQVETPVVVSQLPRPTAGQITVSTMDDDAALQMRLAALEADKLGRKFSLRQVREISEVRALAATIAVDNITFDTGSAAIKATEAEKLTQIGALMTDLIRANPGEIFLVEGHTDAVGSAASNLALSDRRAESVAKALAEYFDVPPENLVVQGYGETDLRIASEGDERANRRAAVRIITPLLSIAAVN